MIRIWAIHNQILIKTMCEQSNNTSPSHAFFHKDTISSKTVPIEQVVCIKHNKNMIIFILLKQSSFEEVIVNQCLQMSWQKKLNHAAWV